MEEFPSHISVVSDIEACSSIEGSEWVQKEIVPCESASQDDIVSRPSVSYNPPSILVSLQSVVTEFYSCFPEFCPATPIYQFIEKENAYRLSIPFTSRIREGILVYTLSQSTFKHWKATFEPFLSSKGIDWVTLYYVQFEPALYTLERVLEDVFTQDYRQV